MLNLEQFTKIWLVDFEFSAPPGELPNVRCMVAMEYRSKEKIRLWINEIGGLAEPPYSINQNTLLVAYYASAELSCHLVLGWGLPVYVLDLFVEC